MPSPLPSLIFRCISSSRSMITLSTFPTSAAPWLAKANCTSPMILVPSLWIPTATFLRSAHNPSTTA
jgi:hypothetical protein